MNKHFSLGDFFYQYNYLFETQSVDTRHYKQKLQQAQKYIAKQINYSLYFERLRINI